LLDGLDDDRIHANYNFISPFKIFDLGGREEGLKIRIIFIFLSLA